MNDLEFEQAKKCLEDNGFNYVQFRLKVMAEAKTQIKEESDFHTNVFNSNQKYRVQVYDALVDKNLTIENWKDLRDDEVVFLCAKLDLSNGAIASIFNISTSTVKARYSKLGINKSTTFGSYAVTQAETFAFLECVKEKFNI